MKKLDKILYIMQAICVLLCMGMSMYAIIQHDMQGATFTMVIAIANLILIFMSNGGDDGGYAT